MAVFFALSPLVLILALLLVFRRGAVETSAAGVGAAILVGVWVFGFPWPEVVLSIKNGLDPALRVVYVLAAGLWLYQLLRRTGVLQRISESVDRLSENPLRRALFVVVVAAPFLEAVSGFGAGIVLAGPLILGLGYNGMQAAVLALLTQSAVPWGAMAVGTTLGAEIAGVDVVRLGVLSALFAIPILLYWSLAVAVVSGGWRRAARQVGDVLSAAGLMSGGLYLSNRFVSVEAACVFAGLVAGTVLSFAWKNRQARLRTPESEVSLKKAVFPYAVFLALVAATRLLGEIPQVGAWFKSHPYIYSPGTAMLLTCGAVVRMFRMTLPEVLQSIVDTWQQVRPAALSTLGFVLTGTVMKDAQMIAIVTESLGDAGAIFPVLAPLVGGLGGWITGSNAAANAMWMHFQAGMAMTVGLPADLAAAVQNTSAANLTMASPSRVALGAAVAGVSGREGELLRRVGLLALGVLGIVTLVAFAYMYG